MAAEMVQKPQTALQSDMPAIKAKTSDPEKNPAAAPSRPIITKMFLRMMTPAVTPKRRATIDTTTMPTVDYIQPMAKEKDVTRTMVKRAAIAAVTYGNHFSPKRAMRGPATT